MPKLIIEYDGSEPIREIHADIVLDPSAGLEKAAQTLNSDSDKLISSTN